MYQMLIVAGVAMVKKKKKKRERDRERDLDSAFKKLKIHQKTPKRE